MHNPERPKKTDYQECIRRVLHYINQNLTGDVSLETLAEVANYSPFHFQKIFSEAVHESPKQYVIRLRLERSAHFIKIFPLLPIKEISLNCGFTSNSIFSRAFKNYYGVSAEVFRDLPTEGLHEITERKNRMSAWDDSTWITPIRDIQQKMNAVTLSPPPTISTLYSFNVACIQTTLSHKENIPFAFQNLLKWAQPRGLISATTKFIGIWLDFPFITPADKCRYLCGIEIGADIKPTKGIHVMNISKTHCMKYGMEGDMNKTLDALIALNHVHVDSMGYTIAEMICYEQFDVCPSDHSYEEIHRHLHIPIKAK